MTRRGFLKLLLASLAVLFFGGGGFLYKWLTRSNTTAESAAPADEKPAKPASPSEHTPVPSGSPAPVEPLLSLFILSDLHVSIYDPNTEKKLHLALDDITNFEDKVETIVMTGDLTDYGTPNDYKKLRVILDQYKLPPLHGNMGNHDYYDIWIDKNGSFNRENMPNGKTDAQSRERFQSFFGLDKPYHDVWMNGVHLIMLSQEAYVQERPEVGEGAWYSDEQLEWLKQKMTEHRNGEPALVMIHQPLPPAGQDGGSHRLIRAKAFRSILEPYRNVFVFSGHQHQDFENGSPHYVQETFHWFHNSSVGRPLNRNFQEEAKNKSQGLYVQVYADRVVLRGREFSKKAWIPSAFWTVPLEQSRV